MSIDNAYIAYDDQVRDATVTDGGDTWTNLQNVKDRRLQKIASRSAGSGQIFVEFSESVYLGMIAVLNTNANVQVSALWFAYSDSFSTVVANGSFLFGRSGTTEADNLYALISIGANVPTVDGGNLLIKSISVQLETSSGAVTVGRIFAGRVWWSSNGGKFGSYRLRHEDPSVVVRSYDSTPYIQERQKYRVASMEFHAIPEEEVFTLDGTNASNRECLDAVEQTAGSSDEVILLPSYRSGTDAAVIMTAQAVYGLAKWEDLSQYEKVAGSWYYSKQITVTESR